MLNITYIPLRSIIQVIKMTKMGMPIKKKISTELSERPSSMKWQSMVQIYREK
jgi:hypothetical protein